LSCGKSCASCRPYRIPFPPFPFRKKNSEKPLEKMFGRLLWALVLLCSVQAVSFDLPAGTYGSPDSQRCFSLYIGTGVLVRGKYSIGQGPLQRLIVEVTDSDGSVHHKNEDATGDTKFSFTTHSYNDYLICFNNVIDPSNNRF
jgi:hypothetical protein